MTTKHTPPQEVHIADAIKMASDLSGRKEYTEEQLALRSLAGAYTKAKALLDAKNSRRGRVTLRLAEELSAITDFVEQYAYSEDAKGYIDSAREALRAAREATR